MDESGRNVVQNCDDAFWSREQQVFNDNYSIFARPWCGLKVKASTSLAPCFVLSTPRTSPCAGPREKRRLVQAERNRTHAIARVMGLLMPTRWTSEDDADSTLQ